MTPEPENDLDYSRRPEQENAVILIGPQLPLPLETDQEKFADYLSRAMIFHTNSNPVNDDGAWLYVIFISLGVIVGASFVLAWLFTKIKVRARILERPPRREWVWGGRRPTPKRRPADELPELPRWHPPKLRSKY